MDINNRDWILKNRDKLGASILEVGSYILPKQESIALRPTLQLFTIQYIGLDIRPGPGVDIVYNGERMPFEDNTFDTVISLDTLEHVKWPRDFVRECVRVLKPQGYIFLATVFSFPFHSIPEDYWRFTPSALKLLLEDSFCKIIELTSPKELDLCYIVKTIGEKI